MCRLAAYLGPERPLEEVIVAPQHSLLRQALAANEAKLAVNGDGFGVAWYGQDAAPGLYRDVLPAWSDGNLPSLCRMIRSHLFLAHVRAGTDGETSRANCHPFTHGRWAFMHNGGIGGFSKARRGLEAELPDALYLARRGTTDSELFFLLMLANGLDHNPVAAFTRACAKVETLGSGPSRFAVALSDGADIWAFRWSTDRIHPSLYISRPGGIGTVLASEPLDNHRDNWAEVPRQSAVRINKAGFRFLNLNEKRAA